jgi:hypothetical protein
VPTYDETLADIHHRRRRRRWIVVGLVVLLILLVNLVALATLEEPEFTIQSMAVDRINIPGRTVYIIVVMTVDNRNGVSGQLLGVEGDVFSGGQKIGSFDSDETVEIPANSNFTVTIDVAITDAPLPLPDPVLLVEGQARLRVWILGITYHFSHAIPLTYSPDQTNMAPVADIDGPRFVRRDRPALFDGSNSFDPDGKVVGWAWDFGDGNHADGPMAEHSFLAPGVYSVALTVVDQMGERARTTAEIRVLPL